MPYNKPFFIYPTQIQPCIQGIHGLGKTGKTSPQNSLPGKIREFEIDHKISGKNQGILPEIVIPWGFPLDFQGKIREFEIDHKISGKIREFYQR